MLKKLSGKIVVRMGLLRRKIKVKIKLVTAAVVITIASALPVSNTNVRAASCPDLKVIFARGSGAEVETNDDYIEFRDKLTEKLVALNLNYEFEDLAYPAVGIGIDNFNVLVGAAVSAGNAYEFGDSVERGVEMLTHEVNNTCIATKFVLAGYSQGAMVVSKSLPKLNAEKVIYAATFGDPKIYLPEGKGPIPDACLGINFSNYREYVPDCMVYTGLLGGYVPYQPAEFIDKLGTWCNGADIFCSTGVSIAAHTSYVEQGRYADAANLIAEKIKNYFNMNTPTSGAAEVAIMFPLNWLKTDNFDRYMSVAQTLAEKVYALGGKVALTWYYTRSQLAAEAIRQCDFSECTEENFHAMLESFPGRVGFYTLDESDGYTNGTLANNLVDATWATVSLLDWTPCAQKSVVIVSEEDAILDFVGYRDESETLNRLTSASLGIGEIKYHVLTNTNLAAAGENNLAKIARKTDGTLMALGDDISALAHEVVNGSSDARCTNTTPRNTDDRDDNVTTDIFALPKIKKYGYEINSGEVKVKFESSSGKVLIILNDTLLGIVNGDNLTIHNMNFAKQNILRLVPLDAEMRGEGVEMIIEWSNGYIGAPSAGVGK